MKTEIRSFFDAVRPAIDSTLDELLPPEHISPTELHRAMRYSVLAGGKRLRPALCVASYSLYHQDYRAILPVASALELAHTYSLIHDDLPSMDNDDFRRGRPSCHKKFGEALAILAGDALLTLTFETIASCSYFEATRLNQAIVRLSSALGTRDGMIAGQVLDLAAEGQVLNAAELEAIHRSKTGALLSTSVWIGAWLAGATPSELDVLLRFGQKIGLAFQIVDDVLDVTESRETLGKTAGKDQVRGKATYPALVGLEHSRRAVRDLTEQARELILPLGSRAQLLVGISEFLETRCN
ncbi:MAG TPA: farnesyl diphosphate synthase [Terriglobia bacterium]|nr:farnesyl diphosphate synthase [Terriglobia bacterium]